MIYENCSVGSSAGAGAKSATPGTADRDCTTQMFELAINLTFNHGALLWQWDGFMHIADRRYAVEMHVSYIYIYTYIRCPLSISMNIYT